MIQPALDRNTLLFNTAVELDIPDSLVQRAVAEYEEVGDWLAAPDSALDPFSPRVYPQGSFRLGTSVRSLTGRQDYDIDLVCLLDLTKAQTTQASLKALVGYRLKLHPRYRAHLEEGSRCWTIDPRDGFHMDVLPAIPDPDGLPESLLITDKDLTRWQHSNPVGYADWFRLQMQERFASQAEVLAKAESLSVEDVPLWRVKTTLQRAVQLLKRDRDVRFGNDPDKPISIIITTLAARAYDNSPDLQEALFNLVIGMKRHIECRDGVYWVPNPVNPYENFADKWEQHPARARKFFDWLARAESDLTVFAKAAGIDNAVSSLVPLFGEGVVRRAAQRLGDGARSQREAGKLFGGGSGALGGAGGQQVKPHNFYGEE